MGFLVQIEAPGNVLTFVVGDAVIRAQIVAKRRSRQMPCIWRDFTSLTYSFQTTSPLVLIYTIVFENTVPASILANPF